VLAQRAGMMQAKSASSARSACADSYQPNSIPVVGFRGTTPANRSRVFGVGLQYACAAPAGPAEGRGILAKPQVQDSDPNNPGRLPPKENLKKVAVFEAEIQAGMEVLEGVLG